MFNIRDRLVVSQLRLCHSSRTLHTYLSVYEIYRLSMVSAKKCEIGVTISARRCPPIERCVIKKFDKTKCVYLTSGFANVSANIKWLSEIMICCTGCEKPALKAERLVFRPAFPGQTHASVKNERIEKRFALILFN